MRQLARLDGPGIERVSLCEALARVSVAHRATVPTGYPPIRDARTPLGPYVEPGTGETTWPAVYTALTHAPPAPTATAKPRAVGHVRSAEGRRVR
jgi:hypothetical protein